MNAINPRGSGWAADGHRYGVVAVIVRSDRYLTIRRSQFVSAPGAICFPGGGIEKGETELQAVVRELNEELGIHKANPLRRLWKSVTPRGVRLAWWLVEHAAQPMRPNQAEVESYAWRTADEILALENLLVSNREFFNAMQDGIFSVSRRSAS